MAADAYITCRVTSGTKALVRKAAEREGLNESALVKKLLSVMLHTSGLSESQPAQPPDRTIRPNRIYVRLRDDDCRVLRDRAHARGIPPATYLSLLARAHLRGTPPLPKQELLALRQSIVELRTVGRTLNHIARALHQGGKPAVPGRAEVNTMVTIAAGLRDHFSDLLKANEVSWNGDGQTPS